MKVRKSKFDLFVMEGPKELFMFVWDCSIDGVAQWRHWSLKKCWAVEDNKYLGKALKKYTLTARIPEHEWRETGINPYMEMLEVRQ